MHRVVCSALGLSLAFATAWAPSALAGDDYVLTIKDHKFEPTDLAIPADTKIKLQVRNLDPTAEEFESSDLNREKVVAGGGEITVFIGPLSQGKYEFFGDFHQDTARGHLVVQ